MDDSPHITDRPESPDDVVSFEEDEQKHLTSDDLLNESDLTQEDVDLADELAKEEKKTGTPITLTKYQKAILNCKARFLAYMICRQGGKTFAAALRIAKKVLQHVQNYYIFSRSERQSANAIAQTMVHLKAIEKVLHSKGKKLPSSKYTSQKLKIGRADGTELQYRRLTIHLPNGSRVVGLPASPDTCVGITGSMYCDEFALHRDSRRIYSRLFPIVSRKEAYEFLITSTPRGVGNKFYEIMTSDEYEHIFDRIIVDIFAAVEQGLVLYDYDGNPVVDAEGIEKLRQALKDPDAWDEEYLVKFIDDVLNLLTYELIGRCERQHNQDGEAYDILRLPTDYDPNRTDLAKLLQPYLTGGELYVGFDQARTKDLSVIWIDEKKEDLLWCRGLLIMKEKDFEFQEAALWQVLRCPGVRRAGIDATGLGMRTAERTVTRFGALAVPINFASNLVDRRGQTHPAKTLLARTILERHQDGQDRYPVLDIIRDDFHRVKRKRGRSPDSFTYFADNDETGHADIFTSKALSDVVAQELTEYTGRADGERLPQGERKQSARREDNLRPDHSMDGISKKQREGALRATLN